MTEDQMLRVVAVMADKIREQERMIEYYKELLTELKKEEKV